MIVLRLPSFWFIPQVSTVVALLLGATAGVPLRAYRSVCLRTVVYSVGEV